MPWNAGDVEGFRKGLSRKQKRKWTAVANGALSSCLEGGGSEKECASRAVRIANSKFEEDRKFNPMFDEETLKKIRAMKLRKDITFGDLMDCPECDDKMKHSMLLAVKKCLDDGGDMDECKKKAMEAGKPKEKEMSDLGDCEMEIFRAGTHNGDPFTEDDLEDIASNYEKLKDELRPKLKITHRDNQDTLAGLMSYGDIVGVFTKKLADGTKRLFARVSNVPKQILDYIKERRFPERSIELYPEFRLGTKDGSPVYRNVLKAIALLGHEMPAVTGMAPIKLEECLECQGTLCFREATDEAKEQKVDVPVELVMAFSIMGERLKKEEVIA